MNTQRDKNKWKRSGAPKSPNTSDDELLFSPVPLSAVWRNDPLKASEKRNSKDKPPNRGIFEPHDAISEIAISNVFRQLRTVVGLLLPELERLQSSLDEALGQVDVKRRKVR